MPAAGGAAVVVNLDILCHCFSFLTAVKFGDIVIASPFPEPGNKNLHVVETRLASSRYGQWN